MDVSVFAQWKEEGNTKRDWAVTVELSEQISAETRLARVKEISIPREETIEIIKNKLNPDNDVAMTSIRVNLLCPVGCLRMTTPTRTKKCNHLQVYIYTFFDSLNFYFSWKKSSYYF